MNTRLYTFTKILWVCIFFGILALIFLKMPLQDLRASVVAIGETSEESTQISEESSDAPDTESENEQEPQVEEAESPEETESPIETLADTAAGLSSEGADGIPEEVELGEAEEVQTDETVEQEPTAPEADSVDETVDDTAPASETTPDAPAPDTNTGGDIVPDQEPSDEELFDPNKLGPVAPENLNPISSTDGIPEEVELGEAEEVQTDETVEQEPTTPEADSVDETVDDTAPASETTPDAPAPDTNTGGDIVPDQEPSDEELFDPNKLGPVAPENLNPISSTDGIPEEVELGEAEEVQTDETVEQEPTAPEADSVDETGVEEGEPTSVYQLGEFLVLEETLQQRVTRFVVQQAMEVQGIINLYIQEFELKSEDSTYIVVRDAASEVPLAPSAQIGQDSVVKIYHDTSATTQQEVPLELGQQVILLRKVGEQEPGSVGTIVRMSIEKKKITYIVEFPMGVVTTGTQVMRTMELDHKQMGKSWNTIDADGQSPDVTYWFTQESAIVRSENGFDIMLENNSEKIARYEIQNGGNVGGVKRKYMTTFGLADADGDRLRFTNLYGEDVSTDEQTNPGDIVFVVDDVARISQLTITDMLGVWWFAQPNSQVPTLEVVFDEDGSVSSFPLDQLWIDEDGRIVFHDEDSDDILAKIYPQPDSDDLVGFFTDGSSFTLSRSPDEKADTVFDYSYEDVTNPRTGKIEKKLIKTRKKFKITNLKQDKTISFSKKIKQKSDPLAPVPLSLKNAQSQASYSNEATFADFPGEGFLQVEDKSVAYIELRGDLELADDVEIGGTDEVSWLHLGNTQRDSIETIVLTVPKIAGQNGVIVCPGASDPTDILGACTNKIELHMSQIQSGNYRLIKVSDPDYWHIKALDVALFSTGGAGWNFENVTGMVSWFDAYDVDGDDIIEGTGEAYSGTWVDKVGNGSAFTVGTSPTYSATGGFTSRPVMTFNGTGYFNISTGGALADQITVFAVHDSDTNTTDKGLLSFYTNSPQNAGFYIDNSGQSISFWKGESTYPYITKDYASAAANPWVAENITSATLDIEDPGNSLLYIDGTSQTMTSSSDAGALSDGSYDLGSWRDVIDTTDNGAQEYEGKIAELIIYNGTLSESDRQDVECHLGEKWGVVPDINCAPSDITLSNTSVRAGKSIGTVVGSLTTTDINTSDTFTYTLGCTTAGVDDAHFGISSADLITDTVFDLSIPDDDDSDNIYEICLRSTDNNSEYIDQNFSIQVLVDPDDLGSLVFHFDAQDVDGDNILFNADGTGEPSDGGSVATWYDKSTTVGGANDATSSNQPVYDIDGVNGYPGLVFNGTSTNMGISNDNTINTSTFTEKTFAIVFRTGSDVTTAQFLYEQGGAQRGYSYGIKDGELYAGIFNNREWDTGHQYKSLSLGTIYANTTYFAVYVQDSTSGVDATNTVKFYKSGVLVSEVDHVDEMRGHSGSIKIGYVNGSRDPWDDSSSGTGDYFGGQIGELLSYNTALTATDVVELHDYFSQKWSINESPSDIALSATSIPEDSASGTVIGTLTTTDADDTAFTYTIVAGTGDEDNSRFTISGDQLKLNFVPDYEVPVDLGDTASNNTYTVRIRTDDGNGNVYEEGFIITVTDTTGATPTDLAVSATTIAENASIGTAIGTLTSTDADSSTFTYTIVDGVGNEDNEHFTITTDQLKIATLLDYEYPIDDGDTVDNNTYSVRVRTTDDTGNIYEEIVIITITDVNAAPTNITLDNADIDDGLPVGTLIGNLSVTDDGEDNPPSYTYTLTCSTAGVDDSHFAINSVKLRSDTVFDYLSPVDANTDNAYEICVRVSDGVNTYDKNLTISVLDATAPVPVTYTPLDGATGVVDSDDLVIEFDEQITKGTGDIVIYVDGDDSVFETIAVTSGNVTITGAGSTDLTINPTGTMNADVKYYVLIDSGAVEDTASNAWTGISVKGDWDFTIASAGYLDVELVDSGGTPITSPVIDFGSVEFSFSDQSKAGTLGTTSSRLRIINDTANPNWTVTIQAASGQFAWDAGGGKTIEYDANTTTGKLSVDPSVASLTRVGGGSTAGITLGSATDFSVSSVITLATSSGADTGASYELQSIDLSQVIPAGTQNGTYTIELQITSI